MDSQWTAPPSVIQQNRTSQSGVCRKPSRDSSEATNWWRVSINRVKIQHVMQLFGLQAFYLLTHIIYYQLLIYNSPDREPKDKTVRWGSMSLALYLFKDLWHWNVWEPPAVQNPSDIKPFTHLIHSQSQNIYESLLTILHKLKMSEP